MRHPFCLSLLLLTVMSGAPAPAWASTITITFTGVVDEILDPHQVLAHVGVQTGDGATATYVLRTEQGGLAALGTRRALRVSIARARCPIARPSRPW